jgi:hypothetical protein
MMKVRPLLARSIERIVGSWGWLIAIRCWLMGNEALLLASYFYFFFAK